MLFSLLNLFISTLKTRNIKLQSCRFDVKFLVQKAQITFKSKNIILNEESNVLYWIT